MDYAFVPGMTPWELFCRMAMQSRPNTDLRPASVTTIPTTVSDFIAQMTGLTADNLLLYGHGFRGDYFNVALDQAHLQRIGQGKPVAYYRDVLQAETAGSIRVPVNDLATGGAIHLKGCSVGAQRKFLEAFKRALGGHMRVTAPKHFQVFAPLPDRQGVFEYFSPTYSVRRKSLGVNGNDPISSGNPGISAAQLVDEFDGAGFKLVDGTTSIPKAWWEQFIGMSTDPFVPPAPGDEPPRIGRFKLDDRIGLTSATRFDPDDGPGILYWFPIYLVHSRSNEYSHDIPDFSTKYPAAVPSDPEYRLATPAEIAILQQELSADPEFTGTFPMWERAGEPDLPRFLTNRNVSRAYSTDDDAMSFGCWRHSFTVRFPACRSRNVIGAFVVDKFNYYPQASGLPFSSHLSESDSTLFLTV
jgi:hypothetical protein